MSDRVDIRSAVKAGMAEAASGESLDRSASSVPDNTQGGSAQGNSLEEAQAQFRALQSKYDKLVSEWEPWKKWAPLGSPAQIEKIFADVIAVAGRSDFKDYAAGRLTLASAPQGSDDDEMLTEAEREVRRVEAKLQTETQARAASDARVDVELAGLRFERAEAELASEYGQIWTDRRDAIRNETMRMVRSGALGLDAINGDVLHRAFAASFDNRKQFEETMRKHFYEKEVRAREEHNDKSTTAPVQQPQGGSPLVYAKTFQEAVALGKRDMEEARRQGRAVA